MVLLESTQEIAWNSGWSRGYKIELEEIKDIIVKHTGKVLQQIKNDPGESTVKPLNDKAINAVDLLAMS